MDDAFRTAFQAMIGIVPAKTELLTQLAQDLRREVENIRTGVSSSLNKGDLLYFDFSITNPTNSALRFQVPDPSAVQRLTTGAQVKGVRYSTLNTGTNSFLISNCFPDTGPSPEPIPPITPELPPTAEQPTPEQPTPTPTPPSISVPPSISTPPSISVPPSISATPPPTSQPVTTPTDVIVPPGGEVTVTVEVEVQPVPVTGTGITVGIPDRDDQVVTQQTVIIPPPAPAPPVRDTLGRITGCAGQILPDYTGFKVGLYEADPADPTGGVKGAVPLTPTEVPDRPDNNVKEGLLPNAENSNPFLLANSDRGSYNFLLDVSRGQLEAGRQYILLVSPTAGTNLNERRIRLDIDQNNNGIVAYRATSLDGKPISATNGATSIDGTLDIKDRDRVGLDLAVLDLSASVCEAAEIQITKTGDRAAAEPGDTVIYRLNIRNLSSTPLNGVVAIDRLPLGLQFRSDSVRAELGGQAIAVNSRSEGREIIFDLAGIAIPQDGAIALAYAASVTPDALRGNGRNSATVNGQRADNASVVRDGPAIHNLRIEPGILSDCGTLIGRVFVDKNMDGEQQADEPGIPNAIVFLDDGNRILTDEKGLFSVANVVSGQRVGTLDLSSLPGYTLAPNRFVSERNSQSRLVRLEPGGLARMNFGVVKTLQQEGNRK